MKIRWLCDVELEVIESFDEALDNADSSTEIFRAGEQTEFDVFGYLERVIDGKLEEDKNFLNIQFGDGSVSFGVSKEWFEEIPA